MDAYPITEFFHVPEHACVIAVRRDGEVVISTSGGLWFTREALSAALAAQDASPDEVKSELERFDRVAQSRRIIYGADGPVATAPL